MVLPILSLKEILRLCTRLLPLPIQKRKKKKEKEKDTNPLLATSHLIKDTKSIAGSLVNYLFSHTRRHGNIVAHTLIKRTIFSFPLLVWIESIPPNVLNFIVSNFASS